MAHQIAAPRSLRSRSSSKSPRLAPYHGRDGKPRYCASMSLAVADTLPAYEAISSDQGNAAYTFSNSQEEGLGTSGTSVRRSMPTSQVLRRKSANNDIVDGPQLVSWDQDVASPQPQTTVITRKSITTLVVRIPATGRIQALTQNHKLGGTIRRVEPSTRLGSEREVLEPCARSDLVRDKQAHACPVLVSLLSRARHKELACWQAEQYLPLRADYTVYLDSAARTLARVDSVFPAVDIADGCKAQIEGASTTFLPHHDLRTDASIRAISEECKDLDSPQDAPGSHDGHSSRASGHLNTSSSYGQTYGHGVTGGQARGRAWSHGSNQSAGGSGDGSSSPLSRPRSAASSVQHAGFNCVFCGTNHRTVGKNCTTKKRYISRLRKHHESHGLFYCTDCFRLFKDVQARANHKRDQCRHRCVSEACPNQGNLRSADPERCTHARNPPRDQWRAIFNLAQKRFDFVHPEGCPDPGHGEDEEEYSDDETQEQPQHRDRLQPPPDRRRSVSQSSLGTDSITSEMPLQTPDQAGVSTHNTVSEQHLTLPVFKEKLAKLRDLVNAMQQFGISLSAADFVSLEQTQINLEFCYRQLAFSYEMSFLPLGHQEGLSAASSSSEPVFPTRPTSFMPPQRMPQQCVNNNSGLGESLNNAESTSQMGSLFSSSQHGIPLLSLDTQMLDVNAESVPRPSQLQQQQYQSDVISNEFYQADNFARWPCI